MTLIPLKITSWIMGKIIKPNRNLEVNLVPSSHHLGLSKFGWEKIGQKVKLCSMLLKLNILVSGTLIVGALDTWHETNPLLLILKITFGDGSLACIRGKVSIAIPGCPKLDEVLYIEGFKATLLSISQMCDKDDAMNFQ